MKILTVWLNRIKQVQFDPANEDVLLDAAFLEQLGNDLNGLILRLLLPHHIGVHLFIAELTGSTYFCDCSPDL